MGRKDPRAGGGEFVSANTQELGKDKWLCSAERQEVPETLAAVADLPPLPLYTRDTLYILSMDVTLEFKICNNKAVPLGGKRDSHVNVLMNSA
ncbi:unnamed protein product [Arctogadus glacialis]